MLSLALAGCSFGDESPRGGSEYHPTSDDVDDEVVDDRPVRLAEVPPPPIMGGTMTVVAESSLVVVSDPDRDAVYVVDLQDFSLRHTIGLAPGSMPWRSVADADGRVHVVLRGTGKVQTLDPALGVFEAPRDVCASPRGIDVSTGDATIVVACASGEVVALPADGGPAETLADLEADVRDVMVDRDGGARVSRFRAASVDGFDADGAPGEGLAVPAWENTTPIDPSEPDRLVPHTAWRTLGLSDGGWLMVHQVASDRTLGQVLPTGYYGGGSCAAVVQSAVTRFDPVAGLVTTGPLSSVVLPVDLAVSPDELWVAVAAAGTCETCATAPAVLFEMPHVVESMYGVGGVGVALGVDETPPPCFDPIPINLPDPTAQAVAVAFDRSGGLLVQTREPAAVFRVGPYDVTRVDTLLLSSLSRYDTGHAQFHENPGSGITCASCHPEGGDDGHIWRFSDFGVRQTPALDVGLAGTEPFHWSGDLEDFTALVDEVFVDRMSAMQPSDERIDALERWATSLRPSVARPMDEAAARGQEVWNRLHCDSCHSGAALTNNDWAELTSAGPLQVPSLRGVAMHPPYMHDGRSATLEAAARDMVARTRPEGVEVSDEEIAELVAYLRTM